MVKSKREKADGPKKVAVGCQGGGMHAAFEVGVLTEILKNIDEQKSGRTSTIKSGSNWWAVAERRPAPCAR